MTTKGTQEILVVAAAAAAMGAIIAVGSAVTYSHLTGGGGGEGGAGAKSEGTVGEQANKEVDSEWALSHASPSPAAPRRAPQRMVQRKETSSTDLSSSSIDLNGGGGASVTRIVLTGGPCGGKSTCLNQLVKRLQEHQYQVLVAPEMPTLLKQLCDCPFPFAPNPTVKDQVSVNYLLSILELELIPA